MMMILLAILNFSAWADSGAKELAGFDPQTDLIAENYEAGAYLIYDCVEKHWTCVSGPYFEECKTKRKNDLYQKTLHHTCASIGAFPTKKSCFQRQLFMTTHDHGTRFCTKDIWKTKELE